MNMMQAVYSRERQRNSVAVMECPKCHEKRYVSAEFIIALDEFREITASIPKFRHEACDSIMEFKALTND